ncbi:MAG TPA: M12 family metallopeptidase [Longimicrobiales bacterium]|nr:M12 family metallopeptidase [Longimicrobiales bacterium]
MPLDPRTSGRLLGVALVLSVSSCQDSDSTTPLSPEGSGEPQAAPVATNVRGLPMMEGYPEPGEPGRGWVVGPDGAPMEVVFEIHEGLAIWEGDIIIGRADEIAATRAELDPAGDGPFKGVVIDADGGNNRWPGGVIPYTINAGNPPTQSIVDGAIDWIEDQTPGVTLVPRSGESDYVTFQNSTGCSSEIGRIGGQQFINLKVNDGVSFCSTGNAAHEILHALGVYHEQTRCDRDSFVTIDYAEVESGKEGNFYKAGSTTETGDCSGAFDVPGTAYDFGSIMHYGVNAFAIGSNPTIIPTVAVPAGVTIGQRNGLSDTDAETIDALYGFNNAPPTLSVSVPSTYPEGSTVPFDASGTTDPDDDDDLIVFTWTFGDGTCPGPAVCSDDAPGHAYTDNGDYGWSVAATDGFDVAAQGATIEITNVAPTVDAGATTATIDEGDTFTRAGSFTDPGADTWSATVDYDDGDGSEALALVGKSFSLSHTYVDGPGIFDVAMSVNDDDGGTGTAGIDVTVNNVAPTVDAGSDVTLTSGETFDFSGSFSDPGVEDDPWDWVITWNDGLAPGTTDGSTADQSALIEASRQVCAAGDYTVNLAVTDKDGGTGQDGVTVTVDFVAVEIVVQPDARTFDSPLNLSRGGVVPVAILSTATVDATTLDPTTITLGDGTDPDTPAAQRGNGDYQTSVEDVNGDGLLDLLVAFRIQDLVANDDLELSTTQLVLRGFQADECVNVQGVDDVTIRP